MADVIRINTFIQERLESEGLLEVRAVEAAQWLDVAGLLNDSRSRPGKPLRDLLRAGLIGGAYQNPPQSHGRWYIRLGQSSQSTRQSPRPRSTVRAPAKTTGSSLEPIVTLEDARAAGFTGFLTVGECIENGLPSGEPSSQSGVYLLCLPASIKTEFIPPDEARATGNVCFPCSTNYLEEKWVDGAETLYIGKATQLRRRLRQLLRHAQARAVNHTGGEIVWQIRGYERILICWSLAPNPRELEKSLIQGFKQSKQGRFPFANRQN